jgi:hypothetical protein
MLSAGRVELLAPQSAFLQLSMEQAIKQVEINLREDKYKVWKSHPTLAEDNPLALDPIQYWQLHAEQFPVLILGNKQAKQAVGLLLACLQIWTSQFDMSLLVRGPISRQRDKTQI